MNWLRNHWITTLTVALGVFLAFLGVAIGLDTSENASSGAELAFGVAAMGLTAAAIFVGLWLIRSGTGNPWIGLGLVAFGCVGGILWFWMLIPPLMAIVVLVFGVALRGLVRELAPEPA
jgi:hypothetical protein